MKWHHAGIEVNDLKRSFSFYQRCFGFEMEKELEWNQEKIIFMVRGPVRIELVQVNKQFDSKDVTSSVHLAWEVESVSTWVEVLSGKSLLPKEGPIKLENGWETVFYEGPDDEVIELFQR